MRSAFIASELVSTPLVVAGVVAAAALVHSAALAQEQGTQSGTQAATGAAAPSRTGTETAAPSQSGTQSSTGAAAPTGEFRKDLPMDVPDTPPPPVVRPEGSFFAVASEPPRLSSQFDDHSIFMSLPDSSDFGRATGVCSCAGASVSVA